ncbi:metallophosphoesterase [Hymenobacter caeli]|uniref:Calcineurin-like phosphoesterase domain-containing protein n=1 Tax=Hymenobacter caeli TaxID=2735894 RepID=A0ABX2FMI9_9BACT|nr:metallophosphoesterase [Hymenobacter caeli]NRT18375.1 hypothetical protein [Hymenobacter caeli]
MKTFFRFIILLGLLAARPAPVRAQLEEIGEAGESPDNPLHPKPNYRRAGRAWKNTPLPDSSHLTYSVFLIGDVGNPVLPANGGEPSLNFLHRQILRAGARSTTVFLGDNIYNQGMPPVGAVDRKTAEGRITAQLDILKGYRGEKYMTPGNHDWIQGTRNGLAQVNREQEFTENYLKQDSTKFAYTGDFWLPRDGCPGPYEVRVQDNLVLIFLNSQWFLTPPEFRAANGFCGIATDADIYAEVDDIIARNQDKHIMVIAHHPLYSDGVHGGYFTFADHLFPLSIVFKYAFVPLPVIGSIYPLARKYGGISQDLAYPAYQAYKKALTTIFDKYPNVVYSNGHEHNLQYFKEGNTSYITSGSGCKTQHVKPGRAGGALFSDKEKGFARVNYYDNGQVWAEFIVPDGKGETAHQVYRTLMYTRADRGVVAAAAGKSGKKKKKKKKDDDDQSEAPVAGLPAQRPDFGRDSLRTLAVNPAYNRHGKFHDWLLGRHYRAEWATPVAFRVLDIATEKGGLTPYKTGGGKQTASLKLRNEAGHGFTLRTIDKDPAAVLPEALRTGLAKAVLQDQVSAQHPYASFALPPLGTAAGILHTNPVPRYIPADPLLGQYYRQFANTPVALEEDVKDSQSNVASLDFATKLVDTDKMLEKLLDDNDNRVDGVAFARSRLFDMWIGDWDRHEDQWRWSEQKGADGARTYVAVPKDRDIAFFKGDGVLPYLSSRKFAVRNFQNFGYDYADYKGLNQTALSNDRTFLGGVSRAQWVEQAEYLKAHLTDEVIEKAFKDRWPAQIYALHGAEIVAKLKSRRALLPDVAGKYADLLADIVEVRGTKKNEKFTVDRRPDGTTRVTVEKISKKGKLSTIYDRTLDVRITDELRLYGIAGQDVFEVRGDVQNAIKLRIIGGTGRDSIIDRSHVAGIRHRTQVYDADTGNVVLTGSEARLRLEPGVDVSRYDHPKRFDLKDYRLNYTGPAVFFGYNIDDGLLLGGGVTHRRYGFRRDPFGSEQTLTANFAPAREAYNLRYTGQFTRVFGHVDLHVAAQFYGPQLLYNFFGLGNDTRNLAVRPPDQPRATNYTVNNSYRVRFNRFSVAPTFERHILNFIKVGVGPQYEQFRVETDPIGKVIQDSIGPGNENRRFGVRSSDFKSNEYLGGLFYFNIDAVDADKDTRIGLRWHNEAQYNFQLNSEKLTYGRLSSEISAYLTPSFPFRITYAGRVGVQHNLGDYRFYQANTLGGTTNLRGYRRTRYAGRTSLYGNFEARLQLFSFNAYLFPGTLGVLGLADAGRVYSDADVRRGLDAFHTGFGGGVYVGILKQAIINVTYSVGEEKLVFVGFNFLF